VKEASVVVQDPRGQQGDWTHPPREGERIAPDSPLWSLVSVDPARLHGEPCFKGTRVPITALFDHLEMEDGFSQFLAAFPDVRREAALAVVQLAGRGLVEGLRRL
jgi:uncharacterized protein (DUF433 family)